ncbi:MAG: DinB family protein [Chloroflexi bacterium]|nr:DinB family protein [Chloroflexota bacterium]
MTNAPDPILQAARVIVRTARDDMRTSIDGLPPEAINWTPPAPDTNSIAVMTHHSIFSTRQWFSVVVDEPPPERDRDAEFKVEYEDADSLIAMLKTTVDECLALISKDRTVDWSAVRSHWNPQTDVQLSAAWAVMHALEHLREHVGEIALTRHIWEAR